MSDDAEPVRGTAARAPLPGVFARGVAMGVAEIVPGVSGGTIAFITGIYDELLRSIASFTVVSPQVLLRDGWRAFARRHNLLFLGTLAAGMAVSFLLAARVIGGLLESHAAVVYGFFLGVIAGSVVHVGGAARAAAPRSWWWMVAGTLGLGAGLALAWFDDDSLARADASMVALFGAGALAATAWMLPGVSGAFVLLLLGLYAPLVAAVNAADLPVLTVFGAGLGLGLLAFSQLLSWLLRRMRAPLLALLTGLMAGSLLLLWRRTGINDFADPLLPAVVAAVAAGVAVVAGLALLARHRRVEGSPEEALS